MPISFGCIPLARIMDSISCNMTEASLRRSGGCSKYFAKVSSATLLVFCTSLARKLGIWYTTFLHGGDKVNKSLLHAVVRNHAYQLLSSNPKKDSKRSGSISRSKSPKKDRVAPSRSTCCDHFKRDTWQVLSDFSKTCSVGIESQSMRLCIVSNKMLVMTSECWLWLRACRKTNVHTSFSDFSSQLRKPSSGSSVWAAPFSDFGTAVHMALTEDVEAPNWCKRSNSHGS